MTKCWIKTLGISTFICGQRQYWTLMLFNSHLKAMLALHSKSKSKQVIYIAVQLPLNKTMRNWIHVRFWLHFEVKRDKTCGAHFQGEVEQISMMKPKALTPHETGLLEYLEDIIGTDKYVEQIEAGAKRCPAFHRLSCWKPWSSWCLDCEAVLIAKGSTYTQMGSELSKLASCIFSK